MITALRRITLVLAASSGMLAATTLAAEAGRLINHSEHRLPPHTEGVIPC